jgi:C4-dicarboxylate transporter, DctQ subunit
MLSSLIRTGSWLRRRAEDVAVALLALMFFAFIAQIVCRYVLAWPAGWAFELSIITWLWGVLFGAAFVVREKDEIRFDVIYSLLSTKVRSVFTIVTAIALVGLFVISLPAVTDYVTFMKVQKTAYIGIRFNWLYAIYIAFAVAVIVRYVWLGWRAVLGEVPETLAASGNTSDSQ